MGYDEPPDEPPTDELEIDRGGTAPAGVVEPPLIASGRRLGERYLLERPLGRGGMAVVWLATDERLGRPVAIKVLSDTLITDEGDLGRFRREAHVAAGLQHPNLVSVYDYDAGQRPYLVMEYIEGGDLAARIELETAPPSDQLARELLSALRHIHAEGVLHRDIKPQNVLIDRHGHARLSDFGIARPRDAAALTRTGQVIGTETYIAPEVMAGKPASERSDLFALGVVLADVVREDEETQLCKLTNRLRDRDPARRPASAAAALAELERGSSRRLPGVPTQPFAVAAAEPDPEPRAPRRPFEPTPPAVHAAPRHGRVLAVAALAAVAAVAIGFALLGGGGDGSAGSDIQARAGNDGSAGSGNAGGGSAGHAASPASDTSATGSTTADSTPAGTAAASGGTAAAASGEDGFALNDQGYALIGEGRYEEAVPLLERAVAALRDAGDESTYNYALYNLANAYLGAGRPADAIPLLEQRLGYDDGQLDQVQATLDQAYAAAGVEPPGGKPEKPPKPEKSPKPE